MVDRAATQLLLLDQHTLLGGRETREERNNDVWGSSSIAGLSLPPISPLPPLSSPPPPPLPHSLPPPFLTHSPPPFAPFLPPSQG